MAHREEPDIARLYHGHSRHLRQRMPDIGSDADAPPRRFRTYPGSPRVDLPGRDFALSVPLGETLRRRESVRDFLLRPLPLETVGRLLHASYGVRGYRQMEGQWTYDRPSPSAGGLYPLELYIVAQLVDGLADGIYHYDARSHQLEQRDTGAAHPDVARITLGQEMIRSANLVVAITAIFQRTMWKYGQRGYRYVWLDAGHLAQNLYLVATALGLGAMAIGGFYDAEMNDLLALPADEEEVIYMVCVGQPSQPPRTVVAEIAADR
jgi:SagB-type dehydrogenase family enzyme